MSRFVKCDRCGIQDYTTGTVNLPPGWLKICGSDLCEPCCQLVRDFIRFTAERAASLPVEPISQDSEAAPASEKLFETEPILADVNTERGTCQTECALSVDTPSGGTSERGDSEINSTVAGENRESQSGTSANSKSKRRKKLKTADKRTNFPHGANDDSPKPDSKEGFQ